MSQRMNNFIDELCKDPNDFSPGRAIRAITSRIDDPDSAHDMMMDTAAENIGHCEHFEDFWKIMEPEGMSEQHARRLWADEMENQRDKWGEL